MHKIRFAGCDVSKASIDVCLLMENARRRGKRFTNSSEGRRELIDWLMCSGVRVRLVLEATGNYSLDLALALHAADDIERMVANPSATRQFAGAQMRRSKTDRVDADVLTDFAARMDFVAWEPPEEAVLALRGIARRAMA